MRATITAWTKGGAIALISAWVLSAWALPVHAATSPEEAADKALEKAIVAACESLGEKADQLPVSSVAVVPLRGGMGEKATELLKINVTKLTPLKVFVRDEDEWETLMREVDWGRRRSDVMDKETIQKFGKIRGVEALLYGTVEDPKKDDLNRIGVIVNLHLAVVETGEQPWAERVEAFELIRPRETVKYVAIAGGVIALLLLVGLIRWAKRPY